jgi:hypothetical protein
MNQRLLILVIAVTLVFFVILTLVFQNICKPQQNVLSSAVSSYVEKTFTEPQVPKPADPLSYDGVKNRLARWLYQYCQR